MALCYHPKVPSDEHITTLLQRWRHGDSGAMEQLLPMVYSELRVIARAYMRQEKRTVTMDTTVLIHEAYLKLVDQQEVDWQDRAHFFGMAATVMRHLLVDQARKRRAQRRGGNDHGGRGNQITLADDQLAPEHRQLDLIQLDDALVALEAQDPRMHKIVVFKFFGGLKIKEIALALNISTATVDREWQMARTWLYHQLNMA